MSLEIDEVFDVMGDLFKQVAKDLSAADDTPGKLDRGEQLLLLQAAISKMIAEATD